MPYWRDPGTEHPPGGAGARTARGHDQGEEGISEWSIDVPFKDRDDLVLDTITAARQQFGEDDDRTQVVDVLARDALFRGVTSGPGQMLDELGGLDQAQTRQRLDWAREQAGLVSATEAERNRAERHFENELARISPPPPPKWSPLQACPAPGCNAIPADENGALVETDLEQFWCPRHEHLAAPGDLEKHVPAIIGLSTTGAPVYSEKERKRIAAWYEEREKEEAG